MLDAALEYARRGWRVFPCHGIHPPGWGMKTPVCGCKLGPACEAAGKHPACARGFLDATLDEASIRKWRSGSNIAIATGAISGLFVIDIDPRHGGFATLAALEREHGAFPRHAVAVSGGGGLHLFFRYPPKGAPIGSGANVFGPGIDLKGDGGYVVAAPSLHVSMKHYRWLRGVIPSRLPNAPAWLLKLARSASSRPSASTDRSNLAAIKTRDHQEGQLLAKLLGARDCASYWKIDCPAREHKTPDAAMYPRENGQVYFTCYSASPCSDIEMRSAVMAMIEEEAADEADEAERC